MRLEKLRVPFNYLDRQFADMDLYLDDIKELVKTGDFTIGAPVGEFERSIAEKSGIPYSVGVASGTDALILSLKVMGVGPGDEVITTPFTFIATVGAIVAAGARPVFVDSNESFLIDPSKIEDAITDKTRVIMPVHYTGNVADMAPIVEIANRRGLAIVEDACQAIMASDGGQPVGSMGDAAGISLHPLKNLNVWGDGGVILTRSEETYGKLRLLRNHGLATRDEVTVFGQNSRLHSLQAVVGIRLLEQLEWITDQRRSIASTYDEAFADLPEFIQTPPVRPSVRHVYHLYMLRVQRRDELLAYLIDNGVEAKIHYPIPVHLQEAAASLGYKKGDFPMSEQSCNSIISLPLHQHLTSDEVQATIEQVRRFYGK
jgi:aminotransferase EvaB